jgi:hypothetical protein
MSLTIKHQHIIIDEDGIGKIAATTAKVLKIKVVEIIETQMEK